jgi:hypothetical protein
MLSLIMVSFIGRVYGKASVAANLFVSHPRDEIKMHISITGSFIIRINPEENGVPISITQVLLSGDK